MRPVVPVGLVLTLAGLAGCGPDGGRPPAATDVVTLTDANFEAEVLKSSRPVLVDFWASWCRPCLDMKPDVRAAAAELRGRAVVGELDVEANAFTAQKYGVDALPALAVFRNGEVVRRLDGPQTREALLRAVEESLSAPAEGVTR